MDDLQALAVFATVVREGSLSAAARRLGSTPSAVSQRLRALEQAHGVRLLHRSTRRLSLTEAGQRLLGPAERLLADAQAAREALALARDALDGELRLSAPVGFARHLGPALAPLLAAHPALQLSLQVDDAMIDLAAHRIDLALRAGPLADSSWVARPLGRFEWLIVGA
ncbi:MAG: LysR family transcriptional regulator, partial [Burkholderiaceae bacterium]|nr:LysR family transcriptional regulator [Burkholderiaceae bacterium]